MLANGASETLVGQNFFDNYTQEFINHNKILNNLTRDLLGGRSGFAVYDYSHGERLTTQHPAYINNQSTFFIQIVTLPQRYIQRLTILSLTKERKLSSYLL